MPELAPWTTARCPLELGRIVLSAAREWLGTPVKWEASLRGKGCDCRGLVAGAARDVGLPVAREVEATIGGYARRIDEAKLIAGLDRLFVPVRPTGSLRGPDGSLLEACRDGDVLAFRINRTVQHLAIFSGAEGERARMVHAYMGDPALVCEVPIGNFWRNRLAGAWRWRMPEREA